MIYLKLNPEVASNFKAGIFIIDKESNLIELTKTFQDASTNREDIAVLIQEGLRYDEIAEILDTAYSDIPESKFMASEYIAISENPGDYKFTQNVATFLTDYKPVNKNLEGFLYPETYYFSKSATAKDIIEKQILTLSEKISTDDYKEIDGSHYSLYEHLIIASMIHLTKKQILRMLCLKDLRMVFKASNYYKSMQPCFIRPKTGKRTLS